MSFQEFSNRVARLGVKIRQDIKNCDYLEDAANKFVNAITQEFSRSFVLSRLFVTIPFHDLPENNKRFVERLAKSKSIISQLRDETPVLSLVGTCGRYESWNSRKNSKGHIGIPLISASFVDSIPMMSRLLKELEIDLEWLKNFDTDIVTKKTGKLSGLFYVEDAATNTDARGRKIISAQDFVARFHVKTVFGMGGFSPLSGKYVVSINFMNMHLPNEGAQLFMRYVNIFNSGIDTRAWKNIFRPE